nr:hypothetical protein CFP56_71478 [Quercus suber]
MPVIDSEKAISTIKSGEYTAKDIGIHSGDPLDIKAGTAVTVENFDTVPGSFPQSGKLIGSNQHEFVVELDTGIRLHYPHIGYISWSNECRSLIEKCGRNQKSGGRSGSALPPKFVAGVLRSHAGESQLCFITRMRTSDSAHLTSSAITRPTSIRNDQSYTYSTCNDSTVEADSRRKMLRSKTEYKGKISL